MMQSQNKVWNRNFIYLTLSNFLMCCAYYSLIATLPVYLSTEMHAIKSLVGITLAAYIVASIMVRPFAGFALDKLGRKTIFLAALLMYGILFNGYIIAYTILAVMVIRFFHGLTWGITTTANSTIAIDIIPQKNADKGSVILVCQPHWAWPSDRSSALMFSSGAGITPCSWADR